MPSKYLNDARTGELIQKIYTADRAIATECKSYTDTKIAAEVTRADGKYLPLSGGTMTGTLVTTQAITVRQNADNASSQVYGGTDGTSSKLILFGKANSLYPGAFSLEARDGSNATSLYGTPNGALTWNGYVVEQVHSSGINYIRYENGLQLYYQSVVIPANTTNGVKIFTYSVPFVTVASIQATPLGVADGKLITLVSALNRSSTQYQIQVATATNTVPTYDVYVYMFIVGRWK